MNQSLIVLLAEAPNNTGPDFGKASPVGLLVVVLLLMAVFMLVWSMNRHLKKAREHFASIEDGAGADAATNGTAKNGPAATRESSGESAG